MKLAKVFLLALLCGTAHAESFFKQQDKQEHAAGSFILTLTSYTAFRDTRHPILYGMLIVLGIGVTKELYDRSRSGNHFSTADLAADALGVGAGGLVIYKLEF